MTYKAERSVTVNRPASELFEYWRNVENYSSFMMHLKDLKVISSTESHWKVQGPMHTTFEWDSDITSVIENEMITWKTREGAGFPNMGTVTFHENPSGRGTEVKVTIIYNPPGGVVGKTVAKLFGEDPQFQLDKALINFKQLMEVGELLTLKGQSSGRGIDSTQPSNLSA